MARFSYGGQALIEGVLMRGRDAIAVALRHPDGRIVWSDERLGTGFRGTRWAKLPFMRGLVVLYEVANGKFRLTGKSRSLAKSGRRTPVADYLATQGRFKGMTAETTESVQAWVDARWDGYVARDTDFR